MWSWSYGSWIYNYLCNQCLSPLTLCVWILLRWGVLNTTLCDKVCQCLAAGQWFYPGTPVYSTNKTDHQDITEILLKVALNTKTITPNTILQFFSVKYVALPKSNENLLLWSTRPIWSKFDFDSSWIVCFQQDQWLQDLQIWLWPTFFLPILCL